MADQSAQRQIEAIIKKSGTWHGELLSHLRTVILSAAPAVVEEVKWKKPSRPEGVPVWSHGGIICTGEMLKTAVRLTFPKGAQLNDPNGVFNTRLESKTVRAVDFRENEHVDEAALKALIVEAADLNASSATTKGRAKRESPAGPTTSVESVPERSSRTTATGSA